MSSIDGFAQQLDNLLRRHPEAPSGSGVDIFLSDLTKIFQGQINQIEYYRLSTPSTRKRYSTKFLDFAIALFKHRKEVRSYLLPLEGERPHESGILHAIEFMMQEYAMAQGVMPSSSVAVGLRLLRYLNFIHYACPSLRNALDSGVSGSAVLEAKLDHLIKLPTQENFKALSFSYHELVRFAESIEGEAAKKEQLGKCQAIALWLVDRLIYSGLPVFGAKEKEVDDTLVLDIQAFIGSLVLAPVSSYPDMKEPFHASLYTVLVSRPEGLLLGFGDLPDAVIHLSKALPKERSRQANVAAAALLRLVVDVDGSSGSDSFFSKDICDSAVEKLLGIPVENLFTIAARVTLAEYSAKVGSPIRSDASGRDFMTTSISKFLSEYAAPTSDPDSPLAQGTLMSHPHPDVPRLDLPKRKMDEKQPLNGAGVPPSRRRSFGGMPPRSPGEPTGSFAFATYLQCARDCGVWVISPPRPDSRESIDFSRELDNSSSNYHELVLAFGYVPVPSPATTPERPDQTPAPTPEGQKDRSPRVPVYS